jgi:ankyrin repeat protein
MSADSPRASRSLPQKPDLRHLKDQAKDLVRAGDAPSLPQAQLRLAREYGFVSWPKLKAHVESLHEIGQLKAAIDANDLARVQELMTRNPSLHRAPLGYGSNGPLTWVAECRVPREPPGEARLAMARWMIQHGSDVHQGGDGPLMRAALDDMRLPMMELLLAHGADPNARWSGTYPILCAPCEALQPRALKLLIEHGADLRAASDQYGSCVGMLISTYGRNPEGKHACLEVFAQAGFSLPDTAPMAVHRGRVDLLAALVDRKPALLQRRFRETEIFPPDLGGVGMHVAPLDRGTLLHMAVEYQEVQIARWLIERGTDVNARSGTDADGFGGHTPLFHTTVSLAMKADDTLARLLLRNGTDPNLRATFRKQLRDMGDVEKEQMREYHDVTAVDFARQFQEPAWVNEPAIAAILEHTRHTPP